MGHPWGTWAPYLPIGKRGPSNFWCPNRLTPTSTGIWTNILWWWSAKRAFGLRRCDPLKFSPDTQNTTVFCKNSHQAIQCELNALTPPSQHQKKNKEMSFLYLL